MNLTVMRDGSEIIRYKDAGIPIYLSRGDLVSLSDMAALCHWHEEVELLMPLRGYLSYNVNGEVVKLPEGNGIFVNTRQMHYGFSSDGTDCEYICLTFRPELLCANEEVRNRFVLPILTSPQLPYFVLRRANLEHRSLLATIARLNGVHQEQGPGFELLLLGELFRLWQGLYRVVQEHIGETASTDVNVLIQKQMLEFIRIHYQERISVDAIAAAGGVCRTKCCQIFKKYLGRTPNDYLNSFRLEKAVELLKGTNLTITEIAGETGFSSASYFTELFTKQKGLPPTAYRKKE